MALLEREALLTQLTERLAATRNGQGRLVLVSGEAGIGKTSLVDAFVAQIPRGTPVLRGGCDPVVPARPFAPIADMAGQLRDGLRDALERADRDRVFDRFLALLQQQARGSVVILEDLHWADSATLDLLKVVGRRLPGMPVLVIGTYRPHEIDAEHPLRLMLGEIPSGLVSDVPVPPLSVRAVATLAGAELDAAELHRATGGNPFFVTEVVAGRGSGLPSTVRDAVLARIARLSRDAQQVVRATAVLGARVEPNLVRAVTEGATASSGIRECLERQMLQDHDGFLAFRHELARQAVLDALPPVERVRLNQRALLALRSGIAPADAVRLAQHAIEAGDAREIVDLAPQAAEQAGGLGAHSEAADYLAVALALPGLVDDRRRAEMLERYAYECSMCDRIAAARAAQEASLAIHRERGDRLREGDSLRALATYMWLGGEGDAARATANSAVAILETIEPQGRELADAYAKSAQLLTNAAQDDATARQWASRAMQLAERVGAEDIAVHALTTLALAEIYDETKPALSVGWAHLEEALRRARAGGFSESVLRCLINLVESARELHMYELAATYVQEALAFLQDREFDLYRNLLLSRVAQLELTLGRWDAAEREATALLASPTHSNQVRVRALDVIGRLRARRGVPGAWEALDEAMSIVGRGEIQDIAPLHAARAEAAWLEGDLVRTGNEAMTAIDLVAPVASPPWYGELIFWAWRAGRLDRVPGDAGERFALHSTGAVRDAAAAWRALGCPYEAAVALADSDDERDLRDALATFHSLRANVMAERVTNALRLKGATKVPRGPRASTIANPAGLSARELDVLALIRSGARNSDIAERHVLSPKTIDHHVSAILRKLKVSDREAARLEAERLGLKDGDLARPN
jgi:DNA-binding CsgD family transcriptional regulator